MMTPDTDMSRPRRRAAALARLGIGVLVGAAAFGHVVATALYLLPRNPLTNVYARPLRAYMTPFFEQNWHLFSPNPVTRTERVIVRCRSGDGRWSGWIDPSSRVLESHEGRRGVTGRSYVLRNYVGLARDVSDALDARTAACDRNPSCLGAVSEGLLDDPRLSHVRRYAAMTCRARFADATLAEARLAALSPRPYSKRNASWSPSVARTELGVVELSEAL